ncbi:ChaN family lipoprotein [Bacteroidota bacterium]
MRKIKYPILLLFVAMFINADMPAYKLYNAEGKKAKFKTLVEDASKVDVVLFGELHNNAIGHWLQLELTKSLYELKGDKLVLGAEMFESDQQIILSEYLSGLITKSNFEKGTQLWNNYSTDYKPLVLFAKKKGLPFIATNIPRRYASVVAKYGLDTFPFMIDKHTRIFMAPLPIPYDSLLPGYKNMTHGRDNPDFGFLPMAQAIKDATMAHFILKNLKEGQTFLHFNGAYHSQNYEGIVWYLKQNKPDIKILTISTLEQDTVQKVEEENLKLADYLIIVDSDVTKTY